MTLLEVGDLRVTFPSEDGRVQAVRGVSFHVDAGETLGIVGESGSGKSVTTQAMMRLVPGADVAGSVVFDGLDLLRLDPRRLRSLRGDRVGMVFQDPLTSLHPHFRVGWQIEEAIGAHQRTSRAESRRRAIALLDEVGIPEPDKRFRNFPHQFSGGMRQRVMLAMALSCRPDLLIADEPTTALDVTVQAQLLELIARLQRDHGTAVIMITHDLGVIAEIADRVLTMYAGTIVESAQRRELFAAPHHPYTRGLLSCVPGRGTRGLPLVPIGGQPPSMLHPPPGCAFEPRCNVSLPECTSAQPPLVEIGPQHESACLLAADRVAVTSDTAPPWGCAPHPSPAGELALAPQARGAHSIRTSDATIPDDSVHPLAQEVRRPAAPAPEALVQVRGLVKHFDGPRRAPFGTRGAPVRAVDGVDLDVWPGETLAIVGESGSGKSTLARMITGLINPTSGTVRIAGADLSTLDRAATKAMRRNVQMVFQDPYGSLNPRRRVGSIIADPLVIHERSDGGRRERVQELMALVGLNPEHYNRFPAEFSGGQRQRIGVARALALKPDLIVCDEPVSALDVSIQAQIVNLLEVLQHQLDLTYVVIAHDLGVVQHMADRVAVMYLGRIVEVAATDELFADPRHHYTRALIDAAPVADPADTRPSAPLAGDVPSPIAPPNGCNFHPRCPAGQADCEVIDPVLMDVVDGVDGAVPRHVACLHPRGRCEASVR